MKTKLQVLFVVCAFCFTAFAQTGSDWKWSHQKPQGNTLRWVKMWDANNWYAFGYIGTFMKTTDAGTTWIFNHKAGLYDPTAGAYESIYDAHFFDMNNGVVVGGGGQVAKTTDGGATWNAQVVGSTAVTWYQVYFLDNNIGYVAGTTSGRLAKTTDGGATWTPNATIPSGTYYDVFTGNDTIINVATTSGNVRRSTDGGVSWSLVSTGTTFTVYSIQFSDPNNGWVAGSTGKARYTTDAGATWTDVSTGLPASAFYDIDFHNSAVYITGDVSDIYKTTDMGVTWTPVEFLGPIASQPWTSTYYSTSFLADRFVTVGAFGLTNSVVGVNTPTAHTYFMKAGTLYDVWAESSTGKIIAVGDNGNATTFDQLMYSTNGGSTWNIGTTTADAPRPVTVQTAPEEFVPTEDQPVQSTEVIPNTPAIFRAVDMITPTLGYTVGQFGAVYRTTNGGVSWDSVVTTIGTVYLYDVDFLDAITGWVVGATGNCWKTTDGGTSWTQQTTTLTGIIYSISMANATNGWLAGASGTVNVTTDGGTSWTLQTSGMGTSTIYSIDAVDASTGYLSGASGKVSKTTDGGTTWGLLTLPAEIGTSILYSIDFRDQNHGLTGGSLGKVITTTDGGATWQFGSTAGSTIYGVRAAIAGLDTTSAFTVGTSAYIHKNSLFLVPVELTSFTSSVSGNTVTLHWTTATEKNNQGFEVERKTQTGNFDQIAFVQGNGTTTNISSYSYIDRVETGTYTYRLKQIDYDGSFSYSKEVTADIATPAEFALEQNYPNPFNPSTVIKYAVPQDGMVTLSIYNVLGQKVSTLVNQVQKAGRYDVTFDAGGLSTGIYFYKIESGNFSSVKKMMLIK